MESLGDNPKTITDLPDNCLVLILEKLSLVPDRDAFGLTCPKWQELRDENWLALGFDCGSTFSEIPGETDKYDLPKILERFPHLRSLYFTGCVRLTDLALNRLQELGERNKHIKRLYLDSCPKITNAGLSFVARGFPSLTLISLSCCKISDKGLAFLASSCVALEDVNLSCCLSITDQGISSIVQKCIHLRAMTITHCKGIYGTGFERSSSALAYLRADFCRLKPEGISSIVSGGGLKYLNLSDLSLTSRGDLLGAIGEGFATGLEILNVRGCRGLGDESVVLISKGCPQLAKWDLADCHEVKLAGWKAIAENCNSLQVLHVNGCRNLCQGGLQALARGCRQLSVLYMSNCPQICALARELFAQARPDVVLK